MFLGGFSPEISLSGTLFFPYTVSLHLLESLYSAKFSGSQGFFSRKSASFFDNFLQFSVGPFFPEKKTVSFFTLLFLKFLLGMFFLYILAPGSSFPSHFNLFTLSFLSPFSTKFLALKLFRAVCLRFRLFHCVPLLL